MKSTRFFVVMRYSKSRGIAVGFTDEIKLSNKIVRETGRLFEEKKSVSDMLSCLRRQPGLV